jgi:RNA polymerase sigma-B factor
MSAHAHSLGRIARRTQGWGADTDELFLRLRHTGNPRIREELVSRFMPLARKLASRYISPNEPFDDLVQVASIGLIGAIDRFDPARGVAFPSFAIPTILGELKRHFRGTGWSAHVSRRAQELALSVETGVRDLSARTGRSPSVVELSHYLELDVEEVVAGLDAGHARYAVSLEAPAGPTVEGEADSLLSTLGGEDEGFALTEARLSLAEALRRLPRREAEALSLRLTGDLKQREIAERLGCSQMQVSRLLRRATIRVGELVELDPQGGG